MRTGLVSKLTSPSGNAVLRLDEVRSTIFRDWWFRSTWNGSAYTLDLYRTYDDAVNQQSKMASATHAAGEGVIVSLTLAGGAPFDPTPITAVVSAVGTWTSAIIGWVSGAQAQLSDRFGAILARYTAAGEVFEGVNMIGLGEFSPEILPAIGWMPVPGGITGRAPNRYQRQIPFDFQFAVESPDNASAVRAATEGTERLASIVLDEQRKWGGFAIDTALRGQIDPAKNLGAGREGTVYRGIIPVTVSMPDFAAELNPTDLVGGSGGKYVAGL